MGKHPSRSKLMKFEIVEDGDKAKIDISNENQPKTFITLDYNLLGEAISFLILALNQSMGIRAQAKKELKNSGGQILCNPIGVGPFQLHIAQDKSHVLLELETPHGLSFQFGMSPKQAEGIARKILTDLETYPSPERRH